ncbi:unnamed protein product [Rotaria sordida]|uniref:Uncharacterized protein n=1 Tax=Rotaria sordida TaxID=392033 RepID=A0A819URL1_9BILA|nr:unnamed protein product [Rotaria sordida]CAF4092742.1 unnamed protein product [Rotaria sordida]
MVSKKNDNIKQLQQKRKDEQKQMRRKSSTTYRLKIRERDRKRKAKQRLNSTLLKEKQPLEKTEARQKEGLRRRRAYMARLHRNIEYLTNLSYVQKAQIIRLQRQLLKQKQNNQRLRSLLNSNNKICDTSTADTDNNETESIDNSVMKNMTVKDLFFNNLSPNAKQRAKARIIEQKEILPRGVNRNLRIELGLNISNPIHVSIYAPSKLKDLVINFMNRDDISKVLPDVKKMINGTPIRYRLHNLNILHEQFQAETGASISYSTFSNYVPIHVKKPSLSDWGTCLCSVCLNPQIKLEKLIQTRKLNDIDTDLCYILNDVTKTNNLITILNELKHRPENISYIEWQKEKLPNYNTPVSKKKCCTATLNDFISKFLTEINILKEHIQRIKAQFSAFKQARLDALNTTHIATVQIDWSESFVLKQAREERSAYYNTQNISINSGYVWTKFNSYGFGALSDDTCHAGEATWASIHYLLIKLVKEQNINQINLVTDSTVAQYRNKTIFYLMGQFARAYEIEFKWIYLEAGHGKGSADAMGAVIKKAMADAVAYKPDETFKDSKDLLKAIENRIDLKLHVYETKDIKKVKDTLPKLKSIKGTFELHEVSATKQGLIIFKKLSSDTDIALRVNFFV